MPLRRRSVAAPVAEGHHVRDPVPDDALAGFRRRAAACGIDIAPPLYHLGFWLSWATTPGKMALSLRIVDARTGTKPSPFAFLIRYLGYQLSAVCLLLGFVWISVDRRKQGWHDKIARTLVVRDPS